MDNSIPEDVRKQGFVYMIINIGNGNLYIGSTANYKNRVARHLSLLRLGKHHSKYLQNSWNKYGEENFRFIVVEEFLFRDKTDILLREQFYLNSLNPVYNVTPTAGSQLGAKRSDDSKKRMSIARKGKPLPKGRKLSVQTKIKISKSRTGMKLSDSHKENLRLSSRIGQKLTGQHLLKTQLAAAAKRKPIVKITPDGTEMEIFSSVSEAALLTKIDRNAIRNCLKNRSKTSGGYIWKYQAT